MKTFTILKARLSYSKNNKYVGTIDANNIDEVKEIMKTKFNLNPYYSVILDENRNILYNEFLPLYENE